MQIADYQEQDPLTFDILVLGYGLKKGKPGITTLTRNCLATREPVTLLCYRDDKGEPLGLLELRTPTPNREVGATFVYVHPSHLRKGIGSRLVEAAKALKMDLEAIIRCPANTFSRGGAALVKKMFPDLFKSPG